MLDSVCTLIGAAETSVDEYLNEVTTCQEREVFCRVSDVTRSEYYQAATAGLQPEWTIRLSDFSEYQGEQEVRYDGVVYTVLRTYRDSGSFHSRGGMHANEIELVVGRKIGTNAKGAIE